MAAASVLVALGAAALGASQMGLFSSSKGDDGPDDDADPTTSTQRRPGGGENDSSPDGESDPDTESNPDDDEEGGDDPPSGDPGDTVPPTITNVLAVASGTGGQKITWTVADDSGQAHSRVDWGTSPAYGSFSPMQEGVGAKSASLMGLQIGTTYHYRVAAGDDAANGAFSPDATFTIQEGIVLSNICIATNEGIQAKVHYVLAGPPDVQSYVEWGLTTAYGSESGFHTGPGDLEGLLQPLATGSTYHYRVVAGGQASNDGAFVANTTPPNCEGQNGGGEGAELET